MPELPPVTTVIFPSSFPIRPTPRVSRARERRGLRSCPFAGRFAVTQDLVAGMDGKFDGHRPLGDAKHLGTDVHDAPTEFETEVGRAAADPGDLDDQVRRVVDAQIALFGIDDLVRL